MKINVEIDTKTYIKLHMKIAIWILSERYLGDWWVCSRLGGLFMQSSRKTAAMMRWALLHENDDDDDGDCDGDGDGDSDGDEKRL